MKDNYFERIDVSPSVDNAIEEGINKAVKQKRKKRRKNMAITSCISLIIVASTLFYSDEVSANAKQVFFDIASFLGIDTDLNKYKTTISESITHNGYTITVNEAILDKNELTISSTIKSEEKPFNGHPDIVPSIYIDGERIHSNSYGESERVDDFTVNSVSTYFLDKDLTGNVNIKIDYTGMQILNESKSEKIEGSWSFDFNTDADSLIKDTITISLNKKIEVKNGKSIELDKYISNNLGTKIKFNQPDNGIEYSMKLIGSDDLGNSIDFYNSYSNNGYGVFNLDNAYGNINKDATKLRLYLYVLDESSKEEWEKRGSEIRIKLK